MMLRYPSVTRSTARLSCPRCLHTCAAMPGHLRRYLADCDPLRLTICPLLSFLFSCSPRLYLLLQTTPWRRLPGSNFLSVKPSWPRCTPRRCPYRPQYARQPPLDATIVDRAGDAESPSLVVKRSTGNVRESYRSIETISKTSSLR